MLTKNVEIRVLEHADKTRNVTCKITYLSAHVILDILVIHSDFVVSFKLLKYHVQNLKILVNHLLADLTVSAGRVTDKQFVLVFLNMWVLLQTVVQSVQSAQNVLKTKLVLTKSVKTLVQELVALTLNVLLSITVQYAFVHLGTLVIHLVDATQFLHLNLSKKRFLTEILVYLLHADQTANVETLTNLQFALVCPRILEHHQIADPNVQ